MTRFRFRLALPALFLSGTAVSPATAGEPAAPVPPLARRQEALALLHDGRFDEADARLAPSGTGGPADPATAFFRAFVTYWRLLYDDESASLRDRMDGELDQAIAAANERLDAQPGDPQALLWGGSSRLLLAQLRAAQKHYFAAGLEAKRAKKLLESAARAPGAEVETFFGLGTYNYVADRLPAVVKGIRALLFLPGGDRELGLRQLERCASESRYFSLESRILLVTFYTGKGERLFGEALRQMDAMLRADPEAIAVKDAVSRIDLDLARPEEAARLLDAALDRAGRLPGVDPSVRGQLLLARAQADEGAMELASAERRARQIVASGEPWPTGIVSGARRVLAACDPSGTGDVPPAVAALADGRRLLRSGEHAAAAERLAGALKSGTLPHPWLGRCRLWLAQSLDALGDRPRALALYRAVADGPSFQGRDAAFLHLAVPYVAGGP